MKKRRIKLIKASGRSCWVEIDDTLGSLQCLVDGLIEVIKLSPVDILIVNEEGLIYDLPQNPIASKLADRHIVGDVIKMRSEDLK